MNLQHKTMDDRTHTGDHLSLSLSVSETPPPAVHNPPSNITCHELSPSHTHTHTIRKKKTLTRYTIQNPINIHLTQIPISNPHLITQFTPSSYITTDSSADNEVVTSTELEYSIHTLPNLFKRELKNIIPEY